MEPSEPSGGTKKELTKARKVQFIANQAWSMAVSPGKQFAMTAFMMWYVRKAGEEKTRSAH